MKKNIILFIMLTIFLLLMKYVVKKNKNVTFQEKKTLTVGLSADYIPMAYKDENDIIVGFDLDLIDIICKKLGLNYIVEDIPFDTLVSSLQLNKVDIGVSGFSPTKERKKVLDFSIPYLKGDMVVAIYNKENTNISINSIMDLLNYKLVFNTGYNNLETIKELGFNNFIELISIPECLQAVESNIAEIYIIDKTSADVVLKKRPNFNYVEIKDFSNESSSSAIAFSKKAAELIVKINIIIEELKKDGTLKDLCLKWGVSNELI
jgi:ABC-type amino acid transport substrate-binding protein